MRLWKALGLAGLAGVTATGIIIARDQRQRAQLSPEEVRERLRRRVADGEARRPDGPGGQPGSTDSSARA
jgi:hypothetical protein